MESISGEANAGLEKGLLWRLWLITLRDRLPGVTDFTITYEHVTWTATASALAEVKFIWTTNVCVAALKYQAPAKLTYTAVLAKRCLKDRWCRMFSF